MQLPGTGELWAGVGRTAMAAAQQFGDTLRQSPLNPAVKAQMLAQQKAAQEGVEQFKWADSLPQGYGHWIKTVDAQGNATMIPAAQMTPAFQMKITPEEEGKEEDGQKKADPNASGKQPKKATTTAPAAPVLAPEDQYSGYGASAGAVRTTPATAPVEPPSDNKEREPGELMQPDTAAAIREALQRNRFASSESGIPADYQPPQQPGGSIWSPQRPSPAAPPAPTAQQPPGNVPGSPSDQYAQQQAAAQKEQELAQWQQQSIGQPMTADDAMAWMRNRTTLVQHATFMDHGGPGGSPAFAFGMKTPDGKSGGVNIVPLAQMVANGAGPSVASQNTSVVLSQSDRLKGQQQNALVPDQSQQPPALPGPPAAPDQPPQVAQGGQVWNPQQPTPGVNAPPAPSDYNPAPYQQAVAQAVANPQNLAAEAGRQAGVRSTDTTVYPASASNVVTPVAPLSAEDQKAVENMPDTGDADATTGNPHVGKRGGFDWLRDPDYNNRQYSPLPGPDLFHENRWYLGDAGYRTVELKEGALRHTLLTMSGAVPGINYTWGDIQKMEMPEVMRHLNEGKRLLSTQGDVVGPPQMRAAGLETVIRNLEQVKDIVRVGDTSDYGDEAAKSERKHQEALTLQENKDPTWDGFWARHKGAQMLALGGMHHPMAVDMEQALKLMANGLKAPGMQPVSGLQTPAEPGWSLSGYIPIKNFAIPLDFKKEGKPASDNPLDIPAIRYITQAGDKKEKLARIQQYEDKVIDFYDQTLREGMGDGQRFDLHHLANRADLKAGKALRIKDSQYRDNQGNLVNPYPSEGRNPAAVKSDISELRQVGALPKSETDQGLMAHSLMDVKKFMVNKPTGTHFHWTDDQGTVHEYMVP